MAFLTDEIRCVQGGMAVDGSGFLNKYACAHSKVLLQEHQGCWKQWDGVHMTEISLSLAIHFCTVFFSGKNTYSINVHIYRCLHFKKMTWGKIEILLFSHGECKKYLGVMKMNSCNNSKRNLKPWPTQPKITLGHVVILK